MANRTLQSSNVTFLDQTDDNRLDVYIASNHPNIQILNKTSNSHTPDWSVNNLQLSASVYVDTTQISNGLEIEWYQDSISAATKIGTGTTATVTTNVLAGQPTVVYICKVAYDGLYATKDITFSQVEAVANPGTPGVDAVTFQVYSNNGNILSLDTPAITLQTMAYAGDVAITAGATYQWYVINNGEWVAITGGTSPYLIVTRDDVNFARNYMCKMLFNGGEYIGAITVEDKIDENKVFTSKPSNYVTGDIWIVGSDYTPNEINVGSVLKAQHTNTEYLESDWVAATNYDDNIEKLRGEVDKYNEYFSFDSTNALTITAKDANGNVSPFSTTLASDRLSFNQGTEAVAYIQSNKMKIREAEIESPLTITGRKSGSTVLQYPVLNIGNFSIIVESNGSLSIVANT